MPQLSNQSLSLATPNCCMHTHSYESPSSRLVARLGFWRWCKDAAIPPDHVYLSSLQPQTMPVHTWRQHYLYHPFVKNPGELLEISKPDEGEKHRRYASPQVSWAHIWWFRIVMALGALYSYICYVPYNLMGLKGSWNHVWVWRVTPPLADERQPWTEPWPFLHGSCVSAVSWLFFSPESSSGAFCNNMTLHFFHKNTLFVLIYVSFYSWQ